MNDINFPAGVLQPPLYDAKDGRRAELRQHRLDDRPRTHARLRRPGPQVRRQGNLKDWWTQGGRRAVCESRSDCVVDQYGQYVVVDDIHINSKLTEGEDVADLGGTLLAYIAWKDATKDMTLQERDGLSPDQRFFIGMAQWACEN